MIFETKIKRVRVKGKIIEAEVCDSALSKMRGLMFRRKPRPLLFTFDKPTKQPIHSFFCKPFLALWLNENKIIEQKIVQPFCLFVHPKQPFTYLLEIPLEDAAGII